MNDTASPRTYRGVCDGSSAVALGPDRFAVADDENNILRIYRFGEEQPAGALDIEEFLDAPFRKKNGDFRREESDIEASARIGDRIYWICSHGRNTRGAPMPGRERFFATRVTEDQGLETVGEAYRALREDMLLEPRFAGLELGAAYAAGAWKKAENGEVGFNIEGLAADGKGGLLIAFRNPRPFGKALMLRLKNPGEVVDGRAAPKFGKPILLDLRGSGLRSIERVGESFVLVAGAPGDESPARMKLYVWSGRRRKRARALKSPAIPEGFAAEALFARDGGKSIMLLADDGGMRDAGGKACKDREPEERFFRAVELPADFLDCRDRDAGPARAK